MRGTQGHRWAWAGRARDRCAGPRGVQDSSLPTEHTKARDQVTSCCHHQWGQSGLLTEDPLNTLPVGEIPTEGTGLREQQDSLAAMLLVFPCRILEEGQLLTGSALSAQSHGRAPRPWRTAQRHRSDQMGSRGSRLQTVRIWPMTGQSPWDQAGREPWPGGNSEPAGSSMLPGG